MRAQGAAPGTGIPGQRQIEGNGTDLSTRQWHRGIAAAMQNHPRGQRAGITREALAGRLKPDPLLFRGAQRPKRKVFVRGAAVTR